MWKKLLILYMAIVVPVYSICLLLLISGEVTLFYSGFAVDSEGILYIGTDTKIEKYNKNEYVGEIPVKARNYAFTIQENDTIMLSTALTVYILDSDGNVIDKYEDAGTQVFNQLQYNKNNFITQSGVEYKLISELGRSRIISDDGFIIYEMPYLSYIIKIALFISIISIFVFVPIIIYKSKNIHKK